jgi:glycosyltransferase involved in cell wall biosynthesis
MNAGRRIAVLHDSPGFGGHERAFLTWLPALLASPRIAEFHVFVPGRNEVFLSELHKADHPKLRITLSPHVKGPGEPFQALLRRKYGRAAARFVSQVGADVVLMLQGRIENLATPMAWLPAKTDIVSYVPMAHGGSEMGRSAALSVLTDSVKRLYYARPQRMIVPSQAVAAQARRAGAKGQITVVENVPEPAPDRASRDAAREMLGLPLDRRIALFMGRFDTHQKGLDHLIRDLAQSQGRLDDWLFLLVGAGPAEASLRAAFQQAGIACQFVPWTAEPRRYLAASDVLLAPSRFEGVPLVMLEAMQSGLPILASDIDVYREYLPAFSLRDFSAPVDLPSALTAVTEAEAIEAYRRHTETVCARLDLRTSQGRFLDALLGTSSEPAPATSPNP